MTGARTAGSTATLTFHIQQRVELGGVGLGNCDVLCAAKTRVILPGPRQLLQLQLCLRRGRGGVRAWSQAWTPISAPGQRHRLSPASQCSSCGPVATSRSIEIKCTGTRHGSCCITLPHSPPTACCQSPANPALGHCWRSWCWCSCSSPLTTQQAGPKVGTRGRPAKHSRQLVWRPACLFTLPTLPEYVARIGSRGAHQGIHVGRPDKTESHSEVLSLGRVRPVVGAAPCSKVCRLCPKL